MLIFLYLLTQTRNSINLSDGENITFIILCIIELVIHTMPIVIAIKTNNIKQKNDEIQNELKEIKNLLILQNELLRNQQPNYNQYYQQQPYNQNYNNTGNGNSSQY